MTDDCFEWSRRAFELLSIPLRHLIGWRTCLVYAMLAVVCGGRVCAAPIPVIYSTDLMHPHDDPDDHFDLACMFSMPEADLRAIVLDRGDRQVQQPGFKPVSQLNYLSGRHVPAAVGLRDQLKTPSDTAEDQPAEYQNGVQLILQTLQNTKHKAAIIFVGSGRDVVAAYNRGPDLFHKKVRSIHGFIGEASDPTHREWNVNLDPQAFIRLMRADLPFYWIPCFDGGAWVNHGHASFWRIKQGEVLQETPPLLQRYFLYMLRQATNDPIAYLTQKTSAEDRTWMMSVQRNLWCGALLGLAVGRPLREGGRDLVGFSPVELHVDDNAVVHYGRAAGSRLVQRFEIKDQGRFPAAATRATARLLQSFPTTKQINRAATGSN
jgi:hypothetical protein